MTSDSDRFLLLLLALAALTPTARRYQARRREVTLARRQLTQIHAWIDTFTTETT